MKRYKILLAKIALPISALFFFAEYNDLHYLWIQGLALVVALISLKYLGLWDAIGRNR